LRGHPLVRKRAQLKTLKNLEGEGEKKGKYFPSFYPSPFIFFDGVR